VPEFRQPILSPNLRTSTLQSVALNPHLVCAICSGYYRDPHTITECLHAFCKSCIYVAFYGGARHCPTCHVDLGPDPFRTVLPDRTLQELVGIIFPGLEDADAVMEEEFYAERGIKKKETANVAAVETDPAPPREEVDAGDAGRNGSESPPREETERDGAAAGTPGTPGREADAAQNALRPLGRADRARHVPDDVIKFHLVPEADEGTDSDCRLWPLERPTIRTSKKVKVSQLRKYVYFKLGAGHRSTKNAYSPRDIEILCNGDPLGDELSLLFIKRTRWLMDKKDFTLSYRLGNEVGY